MYGFQAGCVGDAIKDIVKQEEGKGWHWYFNTVRTPQTLELHYPLSVEKPDPKYCRIPINTFYKYFRVRAPFVFTRDILMVKYVICGVVNVGLSC